MQATPYGTYPCIVEWRSSCSLEGFLKVDLVDGGVLGCAESVTRGG